jgi:hypothetical protein
VVARQADVAGEWEQSVPEHQRYERRPLLVVVALAGPRIIEALQVDLHLQRMPATFTVKQ